ncbi:MAG: WG repeat-containing protein [Chryseobacterium sp.]|nr:MAG: WG repeat-containing protein [Chryseobacterium sp.]
MKKCVLILSVIFANKSFGQTIPPPMVENIEYKQGGQDPPIKGIEISPFRQGFARIVKDGKEFYIDVNGQKAFDYMVNNEAVKLGDKYDILDYQKELKETGEMPQTVILFVKDGKKGVLSPDGKEILPAKYDQIDLKNLAYWKLSLDGKQSMYLPDWLELPFFDEINYLDGRYFDIKQGTKWGVYDAKKKVLAVNASYESFDYCGGCTRTSDYVYAKKDGKWGIVGFDGQVLVPFEYDHQHMQMRSDNWIQAFSKKNTPLIVNIKSRQEFAVHEHSTIAKGLLIYVVKGKFGAYNQQGKLAVPFIYDRIDIEGAGAYQNSPGNYLIVTKGEFQGVINLNGKVVVPVQYDHVKVINAYFVLKKGEKTILADATLRELTSVEDGQITYIDGSSEGGIEPLPIFRIGKKAFFGLYFAKTGKYYEPQFYDIDVDHKVGSKIYDLVIAERQGIKTVFDLEGNVLIPGKYNGYTFLTPIGNKRVQVQRDGKIGIYTLDTHQELIPTMYRDYFDFIGADQQTVVCRSGEYGSARIELRLVKDGKLLTEQYYSEIATINSTTFLLSDWKSNKYGLYDAVKKTITNLPYNFVAYIGSNQVLAVSHEDGKAKLYNFHTSKELPMQYQFSFRDEPVPYAAEQPVIVNLFKNGMAVVGQNNKLGYIDESGKLIVPMTFDKAASFDSLGVALVARDTADSYPTYSKIGFINKKGNFVIPLNNSYQDSFYDNFFIVGKILLTKYNPENRELKYGLADSTGKVFLEPIYDQISPAKNDQYLLVKRGHKYGITDANGKWVVPLSFDDIGSRVYDFYGYASPVQFFPMPVKEGDKWKFLTEKGTMLPIEGDRLSY